MVMDSHLTDTTYIEPSLRVLDPILNQRLGDEKGEQRRYLCSSISVFE